MKNYLIDFIKEYINIFNFWGIIFFPILLPLSLAVYLWLKIEEWANS